MARYADLKDKTVVVTGGAEGIGRSTALLFSRQQARVFVADLNADKGRIGGGSFQRRWVVPLRQNRR